MHLRHRFSRTRSSTSVTGVLHSRCPPGGRPTAGPVVPRGRTAISAARWHTSTTSAACRRSSATPSCRLRQRRPPQAGNGRVNAHRRYLTNSFPGLRGPVMGWQAMVMRLRNPGGADAALATVRQVQDQLRDASVQAHNAADRKNAFLTWCDQWATPQLGNTSPTARTCSGNSPTAITAWCRLQKQARKQDRVYI